MAAPEPIYNPSLFNITGAVAYANPQSIDLIFEKRTLSFTGVEPFKIDNVKQVIPLGYNPGVLQISEVDLNLVTVVPNASYTLALRRLDTDEVITYQVITGTGATPASLALLFKTAIENNLGSFVTVNLVGPVLTLTEKTLATKGFQVTSPSGSAITPVAAHNDEVGTLDDVRRYVPSATAGNYQLWVFVYDKPNVNSTYGITGSESAILVYANQLGTGFPLFATKVYETISAANTADPNGRPYDQVYAVLT